MGGESIRAIACADSFAFSCSCCRWLSLWRGAALPQTALLASLFGFNLGVELGQLCIVALFLPLAFTLRNTVFYRRVLTGGSAAIALVALVWFVERAFDIQV